MDSAPAKERRQFSTEASLERAEPVKVPTYWLKECFTRFVEVDSCLAHFAYCGPVEKTVRL